MPMFSNEQVQQEINRLRGMGASWQDVYRDAQRYGIPTDQLSQVTGFSQQQINNFGQQNNLGATGVANPYKDTGLALDRWAKNNPNKASRPITTQGSMMNQMQQQAGGSPLVGIPQMDPNTARQMALARMNQQRAMNPQMAGGVPRGMQMPGMPGMQVPQGPRDPQMPPMNAAMPMQGQSFGPQDMNQFGRQGFAGSQPQQGMMSGQQEEAFKRIQMQDIANVARQSAQPNGLTAMQPTGGLMGMFGQQQSAATGSQMGAGPSAAMANQQAMAQANQQAPAPAPRRNPYGMSMDMMARMNPNAARYYGGG